MCAALARMTRLLGKAERVYANHLSVDEAGPSLLGLQRGEVHPAQGAKTRWDHDNLFRPNLNIPQGREARSRKIGGEPECAGSRRGRFVVSVSP